MTYKAQLTPLGFDGIVPFYRVDIHESGRNEPVATGIEFGGVVSGGTTSGVSQRLEALMATHGFQCEQTPWMELRDGAIRLAPVDVEGGTWQAINWRASR